MAGELQRGCVNKMQGSTLISHLPDNVIEEILIRMPIQDAVRTSILSRKWWNAWLRLPQLVFDEGFYRNSMRRSNNDLMITINDLMVIIYLVLLRHRGPIIKIQISLPEPASCFLMDEVILFLSNNDVKEFILDIKRGRHYRLPSSIFSCPQLKHFKLRSCLVGPPPRFNGFNRLLSLELKDVSITSEVFSSLISICPQLEELKLVTCTDLCDLEITAPKLTCLYLEGAFSSIWIQNSPDLTRVTIFLYDVMRTEQFFDWVTLFAGLPVVEVLELDCGILQLIPVGGIPRRLPTDLSHLKILELHLEYVNDVSTILCFLRSSPNLEKIAIGLPIDLTKDDETVIKRFEVEGWSDICLNQLREVELRDAYCTRFELEFIKLILAKSPVLEKMVIESTDLMDTDDLGFLMEVTQFRRLSPLAQVYYYSR